MVKTFELIHKALLILSFWSTVLLIVHFVRGSSEDGWVLTFANYFTNIFACTLLFLLVSLGFFLMHYRDYKKKINQFSDVVIDGFNSNIGQTFRITPVPKAIIKCDALDLHALYFKGGEIYRENEEKEQAELKKNEDSAKIADLMVEKLTLSNDQKNIQATLINLLYSKKRVEELEDQNSLSKHEEAELIDLKNNIASVDESELKKRISSIKKEITIIEDQVKEITGVEAHSKKSSEKEDEKLIDGIVDSIRNGDGGYTMYGGEDVDVEKYKEHNKKGLLYYRKAFEQLYSTLSAEKRNEVDRNVANLMESLPNYDYVGVVSTTPRVKKLPNFTLDLKSYQLSIFTAFFPIFSWLELRESGCLSGLELRDKRILWGAKGVYDIYVKRDADLKRNKPSAYSIPLKDYKGGKRLAHEEHGCLVELWRFTENAKLVEVKETAKTKVSNNITNHDLLELVKTLLLEEDRINGGNRDKRVGFWYDRKVYLEWEKFMVEARLMFVNYYPNDAHKVKNLDSMIFNAIKEEGFLSMEIKDKFKPLDEGTLHNNGELFDVSWESTKGGGNSNGEEKETISKGTLVLWTRGPFRRIPQVAKKGSNAPSKFTVSDYNCVKGTSFWESREKNNSDIAKGRELVEEQLTKNRAAVEVEIKELEQRANEEKSKPINLNNVVSQPVKKENSLDDFMAHLLANSPDSVNTDTKPADEEKPTDKGIAPPADTSEDDNDDDHQDGSSEFKLEAEINTKPVIKPQKSNKPSKRKGKEVVEKNAFDAEPLIVMEDKIPKEKQGIVLEVREENKTSPTYFIQYLNNHLEKIDSRSKNERSFLSRVYLDRLRFQILSKQIVVKESEKPYWQLNKQQILEYIPIDMQLHLLTQPKIENLYEVIPQPVQNKPTFKEQMVEIQKVINSPIKRIRSINIMKISHSPEIEMYKNLELMLVRPNDLSRFIAQLEEKCFSLRKARNKDIEFNPTPSSTAHYGVYRILATNSHILGELNATLKNYCAYKHKMGFKHFDDEIGKLLDTIFCVNLEASNKTVFVFFAPKRTGSKYLEHVGKAVEKSSTLAQKDMFEEFAEEGVTDGTVDFAMSVSEAELKQEKDKEVTTGGDTNPATEVEIARPDSQEKTGAEIEEPTFEMEEPTFDIEEPTFEMEEPTFDIEEPESDSTNRLDTPDQGIDEPKL